MTRDVIQVNPEENAFDVLRKLSENNVGRLIVMDDGEMVGIISRTDLMTALDVLKSGADLSSGKNQEIEHTGE